MGQERVDKVNLVIEELIDAGHSEAATIAEWKDNLNESWADLLELIDTRMQLLATSCNLHKYFCDSSEILALIQEKQKELPEDLGQDFSTAEAFHHTHTAFDRDLHPLEEKVGLWERDPRGQDQSLPGRAQMITHHVHPQAGASGNLGHSFAITIAAALEHLPQHLAVWGESRTGHASGFVGIPWSCPANPHGPVLQKVHLGLRSYGGQRRAPPV